MTDNPILECIKRVVMEYPAVVPYLQADTLAALEMDGIKTEGYFDRVLWQTVRDFYNSGDATAFLDKMIATIRQQLTRAWREGARDMGVEPSEMTAEDLLELERIISSEYEHVIGLAEDIIQARVNGEGYDKFRDRVGLWANRYTDVVNQARVWFGKRQKLKWVLGKTEEHCQTCAALNGMVAYAYEWERAGIHPQQPPNAVLECQGWNCDCQLVPTTERRSYGVFNQLLDIAAGSQV
jgi:hypothetical protein